MAANPSTRITIETEDKASNAIRRIAMELGALGTSAEGVGPRARAGTDAMSASFDRLALQLAAAVSGYKALEAAVDFGRRGFNFNAQWEESRIGIGSVIAAVNTLTTAQGRTLVGMEKYNAAQQIAEQSMRRIQVMGLETTATTDQLVEGFQALIGPASAVGMTLDQTADFTLAVVQSLGALGIPLNQLSAEARSLLDGTIVPTQDRLAVALGITGEMVKTWKQQGTLVAELNKRLESFKLAGKDVADTWSGLSSNMQDALGFLSGQTGRGLFDGVKQSYRELLVELVDAQNLRAGSGVENIVDSLRRLNDVLGGGVVTLTREFIDKLHELNEPNALMGVEKTLTNIAHTGGRALSIVGGVGSAVGGLLSTTLDGWNSLPEVVQDVGIIGAIVGGAKARAALVGVGLAVEGVQRLLEMGHDFRAVSSGNATMEQEIRVLEQEISSAQQDPNYHMSGSARPLDEMQRRLALLKSQRDTMKTVVRSATGDSVSAFSQDLSARDRAMDAAFKASTTAGLVITGSTRTSTDTKGASKIASATESITEKLARYGDTGTEGQGRIARLTKEYDAFAKVLGATNPQVRAFADVMEYAKQHNGFTPEEVAKSTRAVELETQALEDRAEAIRAATRDDGTIDRQKLSMLTTTAAAEREYRADLLKGIDGAVAARKRELTVEAAHAAVVQENLQARIAFYDELAQLYRNDEALQMRSLNKRLEDFRAAGVAEADIQRWLDRKRLQSATDAYSGMRRVTIEYYEASTNAAAIMGDASSKVISGIEDGIVGTLRRSGNAWEDYGNLVLDILARIAAKGMVTQAMGMFGMGGGGSGGGLFGGLFSGIMAGFSGGAGGTGGAASGAWGSYADRVVGIAGTRAEGGPVFAGKTYLVGERGPELFQPGATGAIHPNQTLTSLSSRQGGSSASETRIASALEKLAEKRDDVRIVNVVDESVVHGALSSPGGERVILNVIRKNSAAIGQMTRR